MRVAFIVLTMLVGLLSHAEAATVKSRSGILIHVAENARSALQCVVNYVEKAGVRIVSMRGYGPGTIAHSLHPSGQAIDINQVGRGVFGRNPRVPGRVADKAADKCGVISGNRWANNDLGHWNLGHMASRSHKHRTILVHHHRERLHKVAVLNRMVVNQKDRFAPI